MNLFQNTDLPVKYQNNDFNVELLIELLIIIIGLEKLVRKLMNLEVIEPFIWMITGALGERSIYLRTIDYFIDCTLMKEL